MKHCEKHLRSYFIGIYWYHALIYSDDEHTFLENDHALKVIWGQNHKNLILFALFYACFGGLYCYFADFICLPVNGAQWIQ
jgi:hypothetical protein